MTRLSQFVAVFGIGLAGFGLWSILHRDPLEKAALSVATAMRDRDPAELYQLMSSREKDALGLSQAQFTEAWNAVYDPIFAQGKVENSAETETLGNPPRSSSSFYTLRIPGRPDVALGTVAQATEEGPAFSVTNDLLIYASVVMSKGHDRDTTSLENRLAFIRASRATLEKWGMRGTYRPDKRRLLTWDELISTYEQVIERSQSLHSSGLSRVNP